MGQQKNRGRLPIQKKRKKKNGCLGLVKHGKNNYIIIFLRILEINMFLKIQISQEDFNIAYLIENFFLIRSQKIVKK